MSIYAVRYQDRQTGELYELLDAIDRWCEVYGALNDTNTNSLAYYFLPVKILGDTIIPISVGDEEEEW